MRGLKIQGRWLELILNGQKTMEVRSLYLKINHQRIALGNSNTGKVEGYATVADVLEIPFPEIAKYENQHLATEWLIPRYEGRPHLYGYIPKNVTRPAARPMPRDDRLIFNTPFLNNLTLQFG